MALKFPPLYFLFLLAFFAVLLCLDEGHKEYKESQLLVEKGIGTGNLGAWMHWTPVDYMIFDQCMPRPEKLRDDPIGSYRLHVYCSTSGCTDAEEAKIFICYPSTLDPEALPDEDVSEGKMPFLRAPRQFWVQTDPDHEISKTCSELMEKCSNDANCKQKVGDRVLHGFSVKREKDKFVIEMPFGKNGIGKCFNVSDNSGRFYMNFGNSEDSMHTYVIPGDISNIWPGDPLRGMVIDAENEKAMKNFKSNMDVGMPLERAQHLWMLGIDLLGTVEQQKLHFFTKGEPKEIEFITCNKADKNLSADRDYRKKFINAKYFMPSALDMDKLENMHEEGFHVEPKPPAEKLINVNGMPGHEHIEKLTIPLPNIVFFLSGWVPEKATNFSILLYHGIKQLTEKLGQKVMEIVVAFDGKTIKECKVNSFLSENMIKFCNINDQGKPPAFTPGEKFLLWMKIHDGQMEISLNCNERTSKIGVIPYSSKNYIKFTGNLELVIVGKKEGIDVAVDMDKTESFDELIGKSPVLLVQEIDLIANQSKLFIVTSKFAMSNKEDQTNIEILLINSTDPNMSFAFNIEKKACSNFEANDVKNCTENNINTCISIKWINGNKSDSKPICLSSTSFELILLCMDKKQSDPQDAQKQTKKLEMYLNHIEVANVPENDQICGLNTIQIKGGLEYPVKEDHLDFVNEYSSEKLHKQEFEMIRDQYVNIHLLWLGKPKNDVNMEGNLQNDITINLICKSCFQDKKISDKTSLRIIINVLNSTISAETFKGIIKMDPDTNKKTMEKGIFEAKNATIYDHENSFWVKIFIIEDKGDNYTIKIYRNGAHLMNITLNERIFSTDQFEFHGNIALFNELFAFPFMYKFFNDLGYKGNLNENSKLTVKWRIMKNAELFELFVAKGDKYNIDMLGTAKQNAFALNDSSKVKLFMHIRAEKNMNNGKICISSSLINEEDSKCSQFVKNEYGEELKILDPKMFKEENVHTMEITFNNKYANIQFDNYDPVKLDAQDNDLLEAKAFVINGDITIIQAPKMIQPNGKPTEMPKVNPPKINK